jgi:predicted secreted protein
MASVVNGSNVVLYYTNQNTTFYLNGSIPETTISGLVYNQYGLVNNNGPAANFSRTGDGIVAGFIMDVATPTIPAGTWTYNFFASITGNLTTNPRIVLRTYIYNGTTLTLINEADAVFFTQLGIKQYTQTFINLTTRTLLPNERIVLQVWASEIYERTMTFYTEGTNIATVNTTIPVGIPFGAATNCSFEVSVDSLEVSSQACGYFKVFKPDMATWKVDCDGFIALRDYSYLFLANLQLTRSQILIKFQIDNDNGNGSNELGFTVFSGSAFLSSLTMSGGVEDASTYSVSLQGSGPYTIQGTQVTPSSVVIKGTNVVMFDYTAAGAETFITWPGSIGLSCVSVTRGGIEVRTIAVSGVPTAENVTFNSTTGTLTFARALESDEFVRAIFK